MELHLTWSLFYQPHEKLQLTLIVEIVAESHKKWKRNSTQKNTDFLRNANLLDWHAIKPSHINLLMKWLKWVNTFCVSVFRRLFTAILCTFSLLGMDICADIWLEQIKQFICRVCRVSFQQQQQRDDRVETFFHTHSSPRRHAMVATKTS